MKGNEEINLQKFFKINSFKYGLGVHRKLKGRVAYHRKAVLIIADTRTTGADALRDEELDEELADVLIAISVISKRLAKKINDNQKGEKKECTNITD